MTKNYLKETAKEYIEKYTERLNKFMNEFEADENDFVNKEIEYFYQTLLDVENSESSHDGYSTTGIDNFSIAYDLCNEIGWDRFKYSIEKKIKFLESKTLLPPQQAERQKPEPTETELSERIKKHYRFFNGNCPRNHKQILNDTDFGKLIKWTICYFENNFNVPEISEPIKVVNTNKTFVQLAFRYLFKELHKNSPYPPTLFEFYQRAFTPYSQDKESNFKAVKNNDEVKKLMQIDY